MRPTCPALLPALLLVVAGCVHASAGGDPGEAAPIDAGPPVRTYAFDLDGDGHNDTDLAVRPCMAPAAGTCLAFDSALVGTGQVVLSEKDGTCKGNPQGPPLAVIGNHVGDALAEVAALYCEHSGAASPPALAVVDLRAQKVVGRAVAPADHAYSFTDYPRGPDGKRYPFLAPSYGDGDTSGFYGTTLWGRLCLYRPDLASDPRCGPGFVAIDAVPAPDSFREVGGYLQDLDGDGWEDITLIYHQRVLTISTGRAAPLGTTEFDVAAATEPNSPKWFHSGRNYGTHAAATGADGTLHAVMVGGSPVGTFTDMFCNVTRFAAVLATTPGQPATRHLAWSSYFGFHSTIFTAYDAQYADDPAAVVARLGNFQGGCIHRFSDSRSVMDGEQVVIFNYFQQDAPIDTCLHEQYALYLPPAWTDAKQAAWSQCAAKNLKAPGLWGMQVLRERDGLPLTGSQNTYVWGRAQGLLPGGEIVYLVEYLPGHTRFDLSDRAATPLRVNALVKGLWTQRGVLPGAGRPKLLTMAPQGSRGVGSYTYLAELLLRDVDGDGLPDVQLEDGTFVGYAKAASSFVVKGR